MDMKILPIEIIEQILSYDNLNIKDVRNFSQTSSYFYDIVCNSNVIWKAQYIKR